MTEKTLANRAEVLEGLPDHPAVKALLAWNAEGLVDARFDRNELTLTVASSDIVPALQALKAAGYNAFEDMTAVDWYPNEPRFQLSYHVLSHQYKERIRLRAMVSGDDPAVESATVVWPGANYRIDRRRQGFVGGGCGDSEGHGRRAVHLQSGARHSA